MTTPCGGGSIPNSCPSNGNLALDGDRWGGVSHFRPDQARLPFDPTANVGRSARNRFVGLVTDVITDTVMTQIEVQRGPHRVVSLMSAEAARELGLEPGSLAVAVVKSTEVLIETPQHASTAESA